MRHTIPLSTAALVAILLLQDLPAAQKQEFKSGLEPGRLIGGPFLPSVVSGKRLRALREFAKKQLQKQNEPPEVIERALKQYDDFPHDPVTEFGNDPVLGVFIREGSEPKDAPLSELLKKLDATVERNKDAYLHGFAIFLSRDARSALTEKKNENVEELIAESKAREKLRKRLADLAEPLKDLVVGFYPYASLKGYQIADAPGVTILLYAKHKVLANYAVPEGKLEGEEIDRVLKDVDRLMKKIKRRPKPKG
jgi:hypothetical protein